MLGTWVNVAAVLIGGSIGLLIQNGLSLRLADTLAPGATVVTVMCDTGMKYLSRK